MVVDCLAVGTSIGPLVADRSRGRLGKKTVNGFRKELRGSPSHLEVKSPGSWSCGRKKGFCK